MKRCSCRGYMNRRKCISLWGWGDGGGVAGWGTTLVGHLTFKWVCHNDESALAQAIKKTSRRLSARVTAAVCHFITGSGGGESRKKKEKRKSAGDETGRHRFFKK